MFFWVIERKVDVGTQVYFRGHNNGDWVTDIEQCQKFKTHGEAMLAKQARQLLNCEPVEHGYMAEAKEDEPNVEDLTTPIVLAESLVAVTADCPDDGNTLTETKWEGQGGQFSGAGASASFETPDEAEGGETESESEADESATLDSSSGDDSSGGSDESLESFELESGSDSSGSDDN